MKVCVPKGWATGKAFVLPDAENSNHPSSIPKMLTKVWKWPSKDSLVCSPDSTSASQSYASRELPRGLAFERLTDTLSFTFMTHVSGTALSTQNALIHLVNVYFNSL